MFTYKSNAMMTKMFPSFAKALVFIALLCNTASEAKPVLVFDNGFDWKQVFDAGFRPRHSNGGMMCCKVWNQEPFAIEIKGLEGQMEFGGGSLYFYFDSKEKLRSISFFSEEKFDMAEGQKRVDAMTNWLKPYITHQMNMPKYIEGTYVDASARGNILVAQIGEYRIKYHFIDTNRPDKQLMGEFSISWSFPGKPTEGFIPNDRKIKPPPGYEDWDMTEVIPTSRGDIRVENSSPVITEEMKAHIASVERKERERGQAAPSTNTDLLPPKPFFTYALLGGVLLVVIALIYAYKQHQNK
jgi:hypothetical protein